MYIDMMHVDIFVGKATVTLTAFIFIVTRVRLQMPLQSDFRLVQIVAFRTFESFSLMVHLGVVNQMMAIIRRAITHRAW